MFHESCILCDKSNTFSKPCKIQLKNFRRERKSVKERWWLKSAFCKSQIIDFFETEKTSLNSGHFYVVLMILFLFARFASSLLYILSLFMDACIHFAKTGDLSSLDISLEWFMSCLETICCLEEVLLHSRRFVGCCELYEMRNILFFSTVAITRHLFILMSIAVLKIVA